MDHNQYVEITKITMEAETDFNTAQWPAEDENAKWYFAVAAIKLLLVMCKLLGIIANNARRIELANNIHVSKGG